MKPFSHISKKDSKGTGIGKGEKWAGEDRRALFLYVEKNGAGNWTAAATSVPGKSAKQVRPLFHAPLYNFHRHTQFVVADDIV